MSVWCEITATTTGAKHCSLKKLIHDLFNGEDFVIRTGATIDKFQLSLCCEGDEAVKKVKLLVEKLQNCTEHFDLEATTRWIK